ncbi:MAG: heavy-metal-associated domain-containing protein [Cyclobacteriaceae bacterium]
MNQSKIMISNLSCNGCANTITKNLSAIEGVEVVDISFENNEVSINHAESVNRNILLDKLRSLGYPEISEKNGLVTQIKSVGSCMVGKMSG